MDMGRYRGLTNGGGQRHASRDEVARGRATGGHHAKLALVDEVGQVLNLGLERKILEVGLLVGVGGSIACGSVGERHVDYW